MDQLWASLSPRQAMDPASGVVYMAEPPPGQVRQANPPTMHPQLIATGVSTTVIAAVAVALRIFTRAHVTKGGISVDDYLVVIALLFSIAMLGASIKHFTVGIGYHFWDVPMSDWMVEFQVMTLVQTILYALSLAFSKLSILFLYLRLSPQRWFRTLVWCTIGVVISYALIYTLISLFGCRPIAATWDLTKVPGATCLDQLTKYMALSILNIIIDVFELLLPIPVVAPLQMSIRQKVTICGLFATGGFVCAVAIKRTTLLPSLMVSTDYTWEIVEQYHWSFAEVNAGILCATIPALKPFFVRYLPGLLSSSLHSHGRKSQSLKHSVGYDHFNHGRDIQLRKDVSNTAYELQLRDDLSEEMAKSRSDDEARLWPGNSKDVRRDGKGQTLGPLCSVDCGSAGERDTGNGIYVTSETRIEVSRS